jgi:hypothetical protein
VDPDDSETASWLVVEVLDEGVSVLDDADSETVADWCSLWPRGSDVDPDDSDTASCAAEYAASASSFFCSSERHILDWWKEREREGMEDWKLVTRGAARIWRGAETARAAARRKMYLY